jgi:hypothetical protein
MAPSFSGVWKLQTKYQYSSAFPIDTNLLPRTVFGGGQPLGDSAYGTAAGINVMEFVTIASAGNVIDFGDLIHFLNTSLFATMGITAFGNDTRGIFAGGVGAGGGQQGDSNIIQYITYATTGNTTDFGDLPHATHYLTSVSNNVRGAITKGKSTNGTTNEIEYVTIQSTGNTTDFGDLTTARREITNGNTSSKTRGIFAGGRANGVAPQNTIDYITMASAGNATDFGDMTTVRGRGAGSSSETRTVMAGGYTDNAGYASASSTTINVIDYITTASTGNATDFGDLSSTREGLASGSDSTTSVFGGGNTAGSDGINVIESITIASTANATDFGDLSANKTTLACCSSPAPSGANESYFAPAAIGLIAGANPTGNAAGMRTTIQYINIASSGDAVMFGDLTQGSYNGAGVGSSTRAVFGIGATGGTDITSGETISNAMEFSTFSTKGKATDFGDLGRINGSFTGSSNSTIGLFAGGFHNASTPYVSYDFIDQITIASAGNATDHGDLTQARRGAGGVSNTTTAIFGGGYSSQAGALSNIIDSVAFASSGNATDFGDLTSTRQYVAGVSSSTRGVFAGGQQNVIDYITMSSAGNATDFGDLTASKIGAGSLSDKTSGVFPGGIENDTTIDVITIASTGNASDFGDLLYAGWNAATSASNSHGGLS